MSGLQWWVSTLRGVGRPTAARKTRFRLLAMLCRVGLVTHRVPAKGFRCISYILPPSPGFAWRNCIELLSSIVPIDLNDAVRLRFLDVGTCDPFEALFCAVAAYARAKGARRQDPR